MCADLFPFSFDLNSCKYCIFVSSFFKVTFDFCIIYNEPLVSSDFMVHRAMASLLLLFMNF